MPPIQILIVGTNQAITATIARLINQHEEWIATITHSAEQALSICATQAFGLVLIGAGLSDADEVSLCQKLAKAHPNLPFVKHYGGGSGLLFAEIYQVLR